MATLTTVPASGSIVHVTSAVRVAVASGVTNDTSTFNVDHYPTEDAYKYYFRFALAGQDNLESHRFNVSADGDAVWDNVILPAAGTWTLTFRNAADDSAVATASIVVS